MARNALTHFSLGSLLVVGLAAGVGFSPTPDEIAPAPLLPATVATPTMTTTTAVPTTAAVPATAATTSVTATVTTTATTITPAAAEPGTTWSGDCPEGLDERVCEITGPAAIFGPQMIRFAPRIHR